MTVIAKEVIIEKRQVFGGIMELLQLKYFCDAAKTQNFSKTAKTFLVPTSNISQSIKRLEKELGTELFEHDANRITLAKPGIIFYEKARAALELLDEAKNEVSPENLLDICEIKILIFCNRRLVTKAIEDFKKTHPQISFVLRHELEADMDFDILVSDTCPYSYSQRIPLVNEDILIAMSKDNPLSSKGELSVRDLANERFICMPRGRSLYDLTNSICNGAGFSPNITIQTDDPYYVRKYVELGLGIAFVPSCSWEGLFSENVVLKSVGNYPRTTYVYLPTKRGTRGAVSDFLDLLGI